MRTIELYVDLIQMSLVSSCSELFTGRLDYLHVVFLALDIYRFDLRQITAPLRPHVRVGLAGRRQGHISPMLGRDRLFLLQVPDRIDLFAV